MRPSLFCSLLQTFVSSEGSLVDVAEREGTWGADALEKAVAMNELVSQLSFEFHAEVPESEVPPGKPRTPPSFDRPDI